VAKGIRRLADDDVKFNLALSLHSGREVVRKDIMPFTEHNPLDQLKDALKYFHGKTGKKVTYEYVVWEGINDQDKDIDALLEFCRLVPSKVNLIQYNPIGDTRFVPVAGPQLEHYIERLRAEGVVVNVRISRGQDIDAACGQLANKESA
jgi:23S rRNA (adenine2503-C2)-methyltransferase